MEINVNDKNAKKVLITETILRDAHQSQAATRMRLEEMIPALDALDNVGYYSLEAWGGATFDSCLRFLNEDPWERLRVLKSHLKKTPIQMLLRGQNLLGYRHYADDLVEKFVEKSIENGVTVVRVFDALNDSRNLETSVKAIKKYGGVCEATISYTTGPVYTDEYFVTLAKTLESMGADNICLKDMANLLLPFDAFRLVKALKAALKPETKLHLHTHNTTGTQICQLTVVTRQPPDNSIRDILLLQNTHSFWILVKLFSKFSLDQIYYLVNFFNNLFVGKFLVTLFTPAENSAILLNDV